MLPADEMLLVSRSETLDSLKDADLEEFEEPPIFSSAASGEEVMGQLSSEDEELAERPDFPLSGMHAKLFVSEYHHMARLWTGSANATNAAFGAMSSSSSN
jgi:hypothetical protein